MEEILKFQTVFYILPCTDAVVLIFEIVNVSLSFFVDVPNVIIIQVSIEIEHEILLASSTLDISNGHTIFEGNIRTLPFLESLVYRTLFTFSR